MEKRFFLTLVVVMAFSLLFWFVLFPQSSPVRKKPEELQGKKEKVEESGEKKEESLQSKEETATTGEEKAPEKTGEEKKAAEQEVAFDYDKIEGEEEKNIVIDTECCRFTFTNRGGGLSTLYLKHDFTEPQLTDAQKKEERYWYELVGAFNQKGLSFVLRDAAKKAGNQLPLDTALWKTEVGLEGEEKVLTFTYAPGNGLRFIKKFFFPPEGYAWRFFLSISNENPSLEGKDKFFLVRGPSGIRMEGTGRFKTLALAANGKNGAGLRLRAVSEDSLPPGLDPVSLSKDDLFWMGIKNKYFLFILKPSVWKEGRNIEEIHGVSVGSLQDEITLEKIQEEAKRSGVPLTVENREKMAKAAGKRLYTNIELRVKIPPVSGGETVWQSFLYSGPKDTEHFNGEFDSLKKIIDFDLGQTSCGLGFIIVPVSKIMMFLLSGIYAVLGNYGVAIILLTLLIKLVTYPLMRKQQLSMQKYQKQMEKLKPKLEELKKKYKNNRKKFNEEQLKMMKEHGVNPIPLGGCLPMFFTLPIFIGLYSLLNCTYELRHAPFMLWINDLSAPDALYTFSRTVYIIPGILPISRINLLPLLMMVAWYLQQRMAPKPADPQAQQTQKMMMFMPFFFGIMLYDFASGLSLYWLTNSIFGVIEQKFIRRSIQQQQLD